MSEKITFLEQGQTRLKINEVLTIRSNEDTLSVWNGDLIKLLTIFGDVYEGKVEYSIEPYYLVIRIDEDRVAKFGMDIIKSIEIIRYSSFRSADCRVGQQG